MLCPNFNQIGPRMAELQPIKILKFPTSGCYYVTPRSRSRSNFIFLKSPDLLLSIRHTFSSKLQENFFEVIGFSKVTAKPRSRSQRKFATNRPWPIADILQKTPCRYLLPFRSLPVTSVQTDKQTDKQTNILLF